MSYVTRLTVLSVALFTASLSAMQMSLQNSGDSAAHYIKLDIIDAQEALPEVAVQMPINTTKSVQRQPLYKKACGKTVNFICNNALDLLGFISVLAATDDLSERYFNRDLFPTPVAITSDVITLSLAIPTATLCTIRAFKRYCTRNQQ